MERMLIGRRRWIAPWQPNGACGPRALLPAIGKPPRSARFVGASLLAGFCGVAGALAVGTTPRTPTLADPGAPPPVAVETIPTQIAEVSTASE